MRDPSNVFKDAVDELFQGCGQKNPRRIFFAPVFPHAGDNLGMECKKIGRWRLLNACNMSFHHREADSGLSEASSGLSEAILGHPEAGSGL